MKREKDVPLWLISIAVLSFVLALVTNYLWVQWLT